MKGLIVGSGRVDSLSLLQEEIEKADYIICADGGAQYFLSQKRLPDVLLGDMDSIRQEDYRYLVERGVEIRKHPARKNDTDMELAVKAMEEKGIRKIQIFGATGSRMDHTLANSTMVAEKWDQGTEIVLWDAYNRISALQTQTVVKWGEFLSVIPLDPSVTVSLEGVAYPLDHHRIERGSSLGVSNQILEATAKVVVHEGKGLLIQSREK